MMQNFTVQSQTNSEGILRLEVPTDLPDAELQVKITVKPIISPRSHAESKERFEQMLKKYGTQTFSDSVDLLREDRN